MTDRKHSSELIESRDAHNSGSDVEDLKEKDVYHTEVLTSSELMHEAFAGENREHEQGIWQATKDHPMACFWAFIFAFTIVGSNLDDELV
jgi:MFS transporter, SP family, general alpha glucoside:H+ symporter